MVVLCGKNCDFGHYVQSFQPHLFILAIIIDLSHSYLFNGLDLGSRSKANKQHYLFSLFSLTFFQLIRIKFDVVMEQIKMKHCDATLDRSSNSKKSEKKLSCTMVQWQEKNGYLKRGSIQAWDGFARSMFIFV